MFVQNVPTNLGPIEDRLDEELQRLHRPFRPDHSTTEATSIAAAAPVPTEEPEGAPPREWSAEIAQKEKQYYDGPIRFYNLGDSLHSIVHTMGTRQANHNILFVASSLQSAANLIPMACDMAGRERNYAHLALFGRSTLSMDDILEANGVNKEECKVYFHDARGDYPEYSSDYRAEFSVAGGMKHIYDYMHPQALIMDDSQNENIWFTRAMRRKSKEMQHPLIEIPAGRYEDSLWITSLDAGSLDHFFTPNIEIIVQAPNGSAGSLIRLLRSLVNADYTGLKVPKLTIELPPNIEPAALSYLSSLEWPPNEGESPVRSDLLTVRHRIPSARLTSEQASLRFMESFYPSEPHDSYVLVLSPQAELNPLYLKYLYYMILEYRYPSYGYAGAQDLLGFSLDVPSFNIGGDGKFVPPTAADGDFDKIVSSPTANGTVAVPFLYQAPSSAASLFFGEKWVTLHSFLAKRLEASHLGLAYKPKKIVSETEPAWMEYLLELMRARGWSMIYPASSLVTMHNDLAQIPEEYLRPSKDENEKTEDSSREHEHPEEEAFLTADATPVLMEHDESKGVDNIPLHQLLFLEGEPPSPHEMPYLSHDGKLLTKSEVKLRKDRYITVFRSNIGGCDMSQLKRSRVVESLLADDLFCLPGMDLHFDDDEPAETEKAAEVAQALAKGTPKAIDDAAAEATAHAAQEKAESKKTRSDTTSATVETKEEIEATKEKEKETEKEDGDG